jgi:hypothetical protein
MQYFHFKLSALLLLNQTAILSDGNRGALWQFLRYFTERDATALGLLLLFISDITSSIS